MSSPAADASSQLLIFSVAGPVTGEVSSMSVEWTRAGETRVIPLTDNGLSSSDVPWDGVWTGEDIGVVVRDVNARIVAKDLDGTEHVVFWGSVPVADSRGAVLSWQIMNNGSGEWRAGQVSAAWPGETLVIPDGVALYVGAAWTLVCFAVVAALVHVTRREGVGW